MESLIASGDPVGALAHYRVHRALLRDDLGLEPDATLVEFAAAVRHGMSRRAAPTTETPLLVSTSLERVEHQTIVSSPAALSVVGRRRAVLPAIAAAVLVLGIAAALGAKNARFRFRPPAPPAHDSLRLRVVTASVQSGASDATLARGVRDAALAELENDPWLFVVTPAAFVQQAPLIGLDEAVLANPDTVRKYARKMRTHAIVDFGVSRVGTGYVITAEARSASTDSSFGVIAEPAAGPADIPRAMTRLGRSLRERLVAGRSSLSPTTWTLNTTDEPAEAQELYIEARSEISRRNYIEAARRAQAAVGIDSTFALAWRLVHSSLFNAHISADDQLNAISAAFRFSYRVRSPYWRLDIVSAYYRSIGDHERALVFSDSIERLPHVQSSNLGLSYGTLRQYDLAARAYQRAVDASPRGTITVNIPNLVRTLLNEGKVAEAKRDVAEMMRVDSTDTRTFAGRSFVFAALRDWDSLSALGRAKLALARTPMDSSVGTWWVRDAAIVRGQFATFDSMVRLNETVTKGYGSSSDFLAGELQRAQLRATVAADTVRARAIVDSGLAAAPWELLRPMDRPYLAMLLYRASVGDVQRGLGVAREWSRSTPPEYKLRDSFDILVGRGELALASGNAHEALRLFKIADVRGCQPCFYARYARTFDALSERDSARVWFERYTRAFDPLNALGDAVELAHTYLRLGELYEERNDASAAITWYERCTTLLAMSDTPILQARVREIRRRVDRLRKQGG